MRRSDRGPDPGPELGPEEEDAVRRALADARHDEPVPEHVAARLDATLADLGRERQQGTGAPGTVPAPVAPDPAARRRHRRRALLVAAAAVVAGVAVVPALDLGSWTDGGNDGAEVSGTAAEQEAEGEAGGDGAGSGDAEAPARSRTDAAVPGTADAPVVLPDDFAARAERLQPRAAGPASGGSGPLREGCGPAPREGEDLLPVTYDGRAGVLLYRVPDGGARRVELHLCGSDGGPARSATVRAR